MSKTHLNEDDLNASMEHLKSRIHLLEEVLLRLKSYDQKDLSEVVSKLPVLDKAKFYVTLSYAIYSMIFMNLKLNRVDLKDHAVMKELQRVEQYVQKIKEAEASLSQRTIVLNKQAADRIIAHDLSKNLKNDKYKDAAFKKDSKNVDISSKKGVHIRFEKLDKELDVKQAQNVQIQTASPLKNQEKIHKKHKKRQKKKASEE